MLPNNELAHRPETPEIAVDKRVSEVCQWLPTDDTLKSKG
jgi:hypothetical protein